jgi:hypothetical protein
MSRRSLTRSTGRVTAPNGKWPPRRGWCQCGAAGQRHAIQAGTGEPKRFSSAILPAWARKSPQVAGVLPLLYLHGLSSSNFGPALEQFLEPQQSSSSRAAHDGVASTIVRGRSIGQCLETLIRRMAREPIGSTTEVARVTVRHTRRSESLEIPGTRVGHIDVEVGVWWVERHCHLRYR